MIEVNATRHVKSININEMKTTGLKIIMAFLLMNVTYNVCGQGLLNKVAMGVAVDQLMIGDYYKFVLLDKSGKKALSKDLKFVAFEPNSIEDYAVVAFHRDGRSHVTGQKNADGSAQNQYYSVLRMQDDEGAYKYLQKKADANAESPFIAKGQSDCIRIIRQKTENGSYNVPTSDSKVHALLYHVRPSKEHKGCVDLVYPTNDKGAVKTWKTVELLMVQIGEK